MKPQLSGGAVIKGHKANDYRVTAAQGQRLQLRSLASGKTVTIVMVNPQEGKVGPCSQSTRKEYNIKSIQISMSDTVKKLLHGKKN